MGRQLYIQCDYAHFLLRSNSKKQILSHKKNRVLLRFLVLLVIDVLMILDAFDFLEILRKSTYVDTRRVVRNLLK
jgi:hypothetical protein